ncbi:DHH family phosphoesterase [Clostridium oryzae]|uniref:Cyclic-di-AMP phosphodiesterase n=1 Tax=Clostridium oryzae TaxID=1450648 RepID=A0A1V4IFJ1_9CLOT|nr:DHH family phosphoesterase [Clostridium oryzae]OPJ58689.1 bifunctional oligoribonuclease and PAP phosphatase NrnA [Clostridium oryzae]
MDNNKYNYFSTNNILYMLIMALVISLLFYYRHIVVGIVVLTLFAILVVYNIRAIKLQKHEWKKFIENFSLKLDVATRNTLVNSPFPLIITGSNGNIVWYNQNTTSVLKQEEILGKNIENIIKIVNLKNIKELNEKSYKDVNIKDRFYNIYISLINVDDSRDENDKIILFYLNDVTETKKIYDNRECVMLIEVDNLDDVVKMTEESEKPILIAEIEKCINNYAQNLKAMLKKYSSNKYVLSVQHKFITEEIRKKFEILDTVREINVGNKLAVTLSIGVGMGGETPIENGGYANSAKELALGRGGDQVVVKDGEKLSFFGGKTKEVEKRTRVRARVIAQAMRDLIKESSTVFIMGHKNPDADCFGAAVGLASIIRNLDKKCNIVLEPPINGIKQLLQKFSGDIDYSDIFINTDDFKEKFDENSLLVLVDVHNRSYVLSEEIVNISRRIVIIDHHRKAPDYIGNTILSYIEPYASSTSELITEIIQYIEEKVNVKQVEAEALLAGICVDTKNFCFKTGVRTFEAASFLRRLGADTVDVKRLFSDDLDTYIKRAQILQSAVTENDVAIAVCPEDINDTVLAAQVADELLNIRGIQASFVFVKIDNDVHISGRSLGSINVQMIMESLGGGGHMTMAGAKLENTSVDEAVEQLKNIINKKLMEDEYK